MLGGQNCRDRKGVAFPFSLRRLTCLGIDVLEKVEGCGGRYICVREKETGTQRGNYLVPSGARW